MLPPKAKFVREIETKRASVASFTSSPQTLAAPAPPYATYFAGVPQQERLGEGLLACDLDAGGDRPGTQLSAQSAAKDFSVVGYRQELAVSTAKRRRRFTVLALTLGIVLICGAGLLAFVLMSMRSH
ncbi:hypothetical protein EsH8_VI_000829 [Colletotrichum jinshuiense]